MDEQHLLPVQTREAKRKARLCPTVGLMTIIIATVAFIGLTVILLSVGIRSKPNAGPVVHTDLGDIRGTSHLGGAVEAFYAIPFAQNVSGQNRFMPAQQFTSSWKGVRDATRVGPRCWAPSTFPGAENATAGPIKAPVGVTFDEDCLHLNIYRQKGISAQSQKAVMVWIHGGGMTVGSNVDQNLTAYAQQHDAVMVNVNYRLGPLGFLVVNLDGFNHGNGGMNGIHDQIVALKWIKENIHAFGGDPERVTVAGVSAGGLSVCVLSVSPLAKGLFQRAIVHSGSCTGAWGPGSERYGKQVAKKLMQELNINGVDLTTVHPSLLQWPHNFATDIEFPGYWVDGWVAPTHPRMLYDSADSINPKQMIIGGTSMDGVLPYVPYYETPRIPTTDTDYLPALHDHWACGSKRFIHTLPNHSCGDIGELAAKLYSLDDAPYSLSTHSAAAYVAADADFNINCPARYQAEALAKAGVDAYVYWFEHGPVNSQHPVKTENQVFSAGGWAGHGSDVAFAWALASNVWTQSEHSLSRTISKAWHAFAVSGAPLVTVRGNFSVSWPRYHSSQHATMVLGSGLDGAGAEVRHGFKDDQCTLWRQVYSNSSMWQPPFH